MKIRKITVMYFSPTDTTKKVVSGIAAKLSEKMGITCAQINFTLPEGRKESVRFTKEDLVIVGLPVYAGRVPNILLQYLNLIQGNGAFAVAVVVYGNRNYDDALLELKDILTINGFNVMAGGAFVGEHSFSRLLAKNRPDEKDMLVIREFAEKVYGKVIRQDFKTVIVKGNIPYRDYYRPKKKNGENADIRKVTPKTRSICIQCKLCVIVCPMGSIDSGNVASLQGICIKCGACIKKCPVQAKYYDDEDYLQHKKELEIECVQRKEPELFV